MLSHQGAQWRRECVASGVIEEVHELTEGALVGAHCATAIKRRRGAATAEAACAHRGDDPPGWQRIAAAIAYRGCQPRYGVPAWRADEPVRGSVEQCLAERARWRQQHRQQRVEPPTCRDGRAGRRAGSVAPKPGGDVFECVLPPCLLSPGRRLARHRGGARHGRGRLRRCVASAQRDCETHH